MTVFWKILELYVMEFAGGGSMERSGLYDITERQSVIKKCANEVQMLKE